MMSIYDSQEQSGGEPSSDLLELIWRLCEGAASDEDAARLDEMLLADTANRKAYTRFMQMIALLEHELFEPLADVESPSNAPTVDTTKPTKPAVVFPINETCSLTDGAESGLGGTMQMSWWRGVTTMFSRPFPAAIGASLVVLAVVSLLRLVESPHDEPGNHRLRVQATELPVAYLASAVGNSWGTDTPNLNMLGSPVQLGEQLNLQEGIAEFRLSSGVFLSIEGPASLVLLSPTSLILRYGRLTSNIPESVPDFKVMAGACKLSASRAEFGTYFSGGKTEIHAFAGQVNVLNTALVNEEFSGDSDAAQIGAQESTVAGVSLVDAVVEEGRSLLVSDDGDVVSITGWGAADEAKFATRLPMAEPLPINRSYVAAVMAAKPAGYWRFESIKGRVAKSDVPEIGDLQVVGDVGLVSGPGNRSIELGGAETSYLKSADLTSVISQSDYSVEVWLRPSHIHAAAMIAMVATSESTQDERPGFYLGLQGPRGDALHTQESRVMRPGLVRFLNRNPPSGNMKTGHSCFSTTSYQVRRWQHVVAVKKGAEMLLYVNGEIADTAADELSLPRELRLIVGESATLRRTFPFHGQLDELAIYRRALTEDEVRRHFKAVDWSSDRRSGVLNEAI